MNIAWRIYRLLARAFPQEFKMAYGAEVMQLGEDVVRRHCQKAWRHWADTPGRGHCGSGSARIPERKRRDMRYAMRALIKSPGFALVGIISMGLGMGLTTNLFSSKWQSIFRELPAAANAERLVMP